MDQKWIHILVILVFCQKMTAGEVEKKNIKEGERVEMLCRPGEPGSLIVWFRILDNSGMEFIASFNGAGIKKQNKITPSSNFDYTRSEKFLVTLQSFNREKDSGLYSCASLVRGIELKFGPVYQLVGDKVEVPPTIITTTAKQDLCTTAAACVCDRNNIQGGTSPSGPDMFCTPLMLWPLVGGCGLLLLLLITTILYCNKIRTKRCPHHYKRKPRNTAPGKQVTANRHA